MKNNSFCNFFAFFKQPETVQKKKKILMLSSLRATFLKSTRYVFQDSRFKQFISPKAVYGSNIMMNQRGRTMPKPFMSKNDMIFNF